MDEAVGGLILLALYFLPFIVALVRSHRQTASIFVLNLFLGWTVVGWVVALVMAVGNSDKANTVIVTNTQVVSGLQPAVTPSLTTDAAAAASTAKEATHEHQWVDSEASHEGAGVAVQTRRCTLCGLIEAKELEPEVHEHGWSDPLPSQKFKGRLYQECAGCKEARYIN